MDQKQKLPENNILLRLIKSFLLIFILSMNAEAKLNIAIPTLSNQIDNLKIHSVAEYVIFDDLLRPLIKFESNGEIAPDLAQSWEIKNNYKEFIFTLKPDQYFSDHSKITTQDIIYTFKNLMKNPEIVHGDGYKIKNVFIIDEKQFVIEISESNPFFLTELSAPEFRILKSESNNYKITSGSYSVKNSSPNLLALELNEFYPFNIEVKNKNVDYITYDQNIKTSVKDFKNIDIIWPKSSISSEEIKEFTKNGYYKYDLNLGFSYWLSLNPNLLNFKERLGIKISLDSLFQNSSFFIDNNLTKSRQLFLPFGPGRLKESEIDENNKKISTLESSKLKKMEILLPKNIQKDLLNPLKELFYLSNFHFYSDFGEYDKMIKKKKYDIAFVNNDLSSIDLRSSLIVTFNKTRPLVWLDNKTISYNELLNNIMTNQDSSKRFDSIKDLGLQLLSEVIVYPLYYKYGFVLVKNGIDLTRLNKSGAETSSWKIK